MPHLMHKGKIFYIGSLHFFVDIYAPFFALYLVTAGLDPVKAALISSVASFISNGLQPFLGYLADRVRGKLPIFLGLLIGALSMSLIGITRDYRLLFLLVLMARLGISLFHPAASNIASAASMARKEQGFSIFITMGTIGFALSHPYFSSVTTLLGNRFSFLLALPAVIFAFSYLFFSRLEIAGTVEQLNWQQAGNILLKRAVPLLILFFIMVFRHGFIMTLLFFIARIFSEWGFSRVSFSLANTVFSIAAAAGVLVSGYLATRIKTKTILLLSLLGFQPFFALLIFFGQAGALWPAFVFLALTGFMTQLAHVPNIIIGHRLVPEMTSTVSGILMGFAWAVGDFSITGAAAFSGVFSWAPGTVSGVIITAILPLAAAVLTIFLPEQQELGLKAVDTG